MRILTRYVAWDFLRVFALSLTGMTLFMLLVGVVTEAVREGLSLGPILRILPFLVPESMRFSIPASSLLATCSVLGRMSSDNEIAALKSVGTSPWTVFGPIFTLAFLISVAAVWVNDLAVYWGRPGMTQVILNSMEQIAYAVLRTQKSYTRDGYSITVRNVEGNRLILPVIRFRDPQNPKNRFTVSAREAWLTRSHAGSSMDLTLADAVIEGPNGIEGTFAGEIKHVLSLKRPNTQEDPSDYPLYELSDRQREQRQLVQERAANLAAESAFLVLSGELDRLASTEWADRERQLDADRYRFSRLMTEPWKRWAVSFSCLSFVIVGAPLAMLMRQADVVTTFFTSFMPIVLVYYPLLAYGADRAKTGALPQYSIWLGNVALLIWGAYLLRRAFRY